MRKKILFMLICGWALATTFASCGYDEYADADYPETTIYQPMALESIWNIDTPNPEGSSYVTPGGSKDMRLIKLIISLLYCWVWFSQGLSSNHLLWIYRLIIQLSIR